MKTAVMKVYYLDEKTKKKVMTEASGHSGVVSVSLDPKEMKLTVTGLDPVKLVNKLTKYCPVDLLSVVTLPKKEEPVKVEKKVEPKKFEHKKVKPLKVERKKVEPKKFERKKVEPKKVQANKFADTYDSPKTCVIC